MAKNYIKGKDGKFKGSVPSSSSMPSSLANNKLPSRPTETSVDSSGSRDDLARMAEELRNSGYGRLQPRSAPVWDNVDLTLTSEKGEEEGSAYYCFNNFSNDDVDTPLLGYITPRPNGGYLASYDIDVDGASETVQERDFLLKEEAEQWLQESMTQRAHYIINFDNDWREFPGDIQRKVDDALYNDPLWYESQHEDVRGEGITIASATMQSVETNRSASIMGTDVSGYTTIIKEHADENDEIGTDFMIKHANTFEEALAFGRYVTSGAADKQIIE